MAASRILTLFKKLAEEGNLPTSAQGLGIPSKAPTTPTMSIQEVLTGVLDPTRKKSVAKITDQPVNADTISQEVAEGAGIPLKKGERGPGPENLFDDSRAEPEATASWLLNAVADIVRKENEELAKIPLKREVEGKPVQEKGKPLSLGRRIDTTKKEGIITDPETLPQSIHGYGPRKDKDPTIVQRYQDPIEEYKEASKVKEAYPNTKEAIEKEAIELKLFTKEQIKNKETNLTTAQLKTRVIEARRKRSPSLATYPTKSRGTPKESYVHPEQATRDVADPAMTMKYDPLNPETADFIGGVSPKSAQRIDDLGNIYDVEIRKGQEWEDVDPISVLGLSKSAYEEGAPATKNIKAKDVFPTLRPYDEYAGATPLEGRKIPGDPKLHKSPPHPAPIQDLLDFSKEHKTLLIDIENARRIFKQLPEETQKGFKRSKEAANILELGPFGAMKDVSGKLSKARDVDIELQKGYDALIELEKLLGLKWEYGNRQYKDFPTQTVGERRRVEAFRPVKKNLTKFRSDLGIMGSDKRSGRSQKVMTRKFIEENPATTEQLQREIKPLTEKITFGGMNPKIKQRLEDIQLNKTVNQSNLSSARRVFDQTLEELQGNSPPGKYNKPQQKFVGIVRKKIRDRIDPYTAVEEARKAVGLKPVAFDVGTSTVSSASPMTRESARTDLAKKYPGISSMLFHRATTGGEASDPNVQIPEVSTKEAGTTLGGRSFDELGNLITKEEIIDPSYTPTKGIEGLAFQRTPEELSAARLKQALSQRQRSRHPHLPKESTAQKQPTTISRKQVDPTTDARKFYEQEMIRVLKEILAMPSQQAKPELAFKAGTPINQELIELFKNRGIDPSNPIILQILRRMAPKTAPSKPSSDQIRPPHWR